MPDLLIQDLPGYLYEKLKASATKNNRSLMDEAQCLLEIALDGKETLGKKLPARIQGNFELTDDWLEKAKNEGRS